MMAEAAQLLEMKSLTLLGSTGSIGTNTLDVVRQNRPRYAVHGLAALPVKECGEPIPECA